MERIERIHAAAGERVEVPWMAIVPAGTSALFVVHADIAADGVVRIEMDVQVEAGARATAIVVARGAGEVEVVRKARAIGEGAVMVLGLAADMEGIVRCVDDVRLEARAQVDVVVRGVLRGAARADVTARVHVTRSAAQSRAHAALEHLVLGDRAIAHALPELTVETDDVVCGHRASVVRPSTEALFYLESRGISSNAAEELLASGFLCPMLERMNVSV